MERLNLKVKLKPILQKGMGFCFNSHKFHESRVTLLMKYAPEQLKGEGN